MKSGRMQGIHLVEDSEVIEGEVNLNSGFSNQTEYLTNYKKACLWGSPYLREDNCDREVQVAGGSAEELSQVGLPHT